MRGAAYVIKSWVIIFLLHLFLTVGSQEDETMPEWMTTSTSIQPTTTNNVEITTNNVELDVSSDAYEHDIWLRFDKLIAKMNLRLAVLKSKYEHTLSVVIKQKDSLLEALYDTIYNEIEPLRKLSEESYDCMASLTDKLDKLKSFNVIENKIMECVDVAFRDFENLLAEARQTRDDLNKYYNETLRNELNQCKNQHSYDTPELFECLYDKLTVAYSTTREKSIKFDAQYEAARCAVELGIKRALNCSFLYTWGIIKDMSSASIGIRRCLGIIDPCPCPNK